LLTSGEAEEIIMGRKVYVLMWVDQAAGGATRRARAMFATSTRKAAALRHGRRLGADVYPIPAPGHGWDCPTIRAVFQPIMAGGRQVS
jgi:hypothetical protein